MRRSRTGMRGLRPSAPPVSRVPRTCCSSGAGCSSACWCARPQDAARCGGGAARGGGFCRYYAARGAELFAAAELPGPTGEQHALRCTAAACSVCISPWISRWRSSPGRSPRRSVAGNAVVAKPAPATPLIAHTMTCLPARTGVPAAALQLTPAMARSLPVALTHPAPRRCRLHGLDGDRRHHQPHARQSRWRDRPPSRAAASTRWSSMQPRCPSRWSTTSSPLLLRAQASADSRWRALYLQEEIASA